MTPIWSFPGSRGAVSLPSPPNDLERNLVRGLILALRLRGSIVDTPADLATAMGFELFDAAWTSRSDDAVGIKRDLPPVMRQHVIAQQIGIAISEWVAWARPDAVRNAIEVELMTEAACASSPELAS